jgi:NTE family protein
VDAYGIFEGGGAKAYAHVGALKAAEKRGVLFRKVAGTSAGAIVAALVAAGYTADELFDLSLPKGRRGLLDIDALDIIDRADYLPISALMASTRGMMRRSETSRCGIRAYLYNGWIAFRHSPFALLLGLARLVVCYGGQLRTAFRDFGMIGADPLVDWLDQLLQNKLPGVVGPVTFGHLNMRLRVVAANLRTGEMQEFGTPDHHDLPVAPAVVASACYPFFFRPLWIGDDMYVDGGLVSTHPAWIFDDEREDDPAFLPTFGFRLVGDPLDLAERIAPTSMVEFAQRVVQTLVSRSPRLEERRIDDYYRIPLTAKIPTLSFEDLRAHAHEIVLAGHDCVVQYFNENPGPQNPDYMSRVLFETVRALIAEHQWRDRVRASVIVPIGEGRRAKIIYSVNMDNDSDDRLSVQVDSCGIGACLRRREPVYLRRPLIDLSESGVDKHEITRRPTDICYFYAIPIFDNAGEWAKHDPKERKAPFAALVIDKGENIDALLSDESQQDALANIAAIVGEEVWDKRLVRELHAGPRAPKGPAGWENVDRAGGVVVSRRKVRDIGDTDLGLRLGRTIARLRMHAESDGTMDRQRGC